MAFLADKEELKPGLIIFRRTDVSHRNWYCRVKLPRADRYKTVSLKTSDITAARERAFDHDADVRFRIKHDVPIFNRPFSQIAKEYVDLQRERVEAGQITEHRADLVEGVVRTQLNTYVGTTQIHLVGQDRWDGYAAWRRKTGKGRVREKISDATIRTEMSIFRAIMTFAAGKKLISESHVFKGKLPTDRARREEFSPDEYRKLHTFARGWVKQARTAASTWYRTITYNCILILCNTGMRPPEAKNLRWRDVTVTTNKEGRKLVVLYVRGKGKYRKLVAASNVADYLDRIREISKGTERDDHVFTTHNGKPASTLYCKLIEDLLEKSKLRKGPSGTGRSTYCFRHTYATFRLSEGVDVYFLAEQMGTSVQMIEKHYGHVSPVKNADRILQGLPGWEQTATPRPVIDAREAVAEASPAAAQRSAQAGFGKGKARRASTRPPKRPTRT